MILADKIVLLRKQNGWSQENLAEQMDISRQSVSKWESGASIPDLDKIIKMSNIFGVSTDYLLRDEVEAIEFSDSDIFIEQGNTRSISVEEANTYMDLVRQLSVKIGLGVFICIVSPIFLILIGGIQEYGRLSITEDMASGLGVAVLLVLIVVAVGIFIWNGMQLSKYEYLEKESISLDYGVKGIVEKKKMDFDSSYRKTIIIGVALCILAPAPLMIAAGLNVGEVNYVYAIGILLLLVACGVYLLVWSGMIQGSYDKLLQEGDYTKEKKELNRRTALLAGVYWCIITAIYLGISFWGNQWGRTWIIWPVAGVAYAALVGIAKVVMK